MSSEHISGHLFFLTLFLLTLHSCSQSDQRQILYKFKSTFHQNSNTKVFTTWNYQTPIRNFNGTWNDQTPICNFNGIECNSNGLVSEIDLSSQELVGTLSFDTICSMNSLEKISFGSNLLHGRISPNISNCTNLKYLDLGYNSFSGEVPDLSLLSRLEYLNLNLNRFSGRFPWKSLRNMSALAFLSVGDNPFEETPFPLEILNLKSLYSLYLSNCSIEGEIPEEIGNLSLLETFEVSDSYLVGKIPGSLGSLLSLNSLDLSGNKLSGVIPDSLSSLKLRDIDLSNNMLVGRVPQSLLMVAYNGSFSRNPGLCADDEREDIRQCTPVSHKSNKLQVGVYCFIAGALVLVLSSLCYLFVKLRKNSNKSLLNRVYSWDVKQYHVLKIREEEVVRSLKEENLIGKGGSGNVYKVVLDCGEKLAVKHVWKSELDCGTWRSSRSSAAILPKRKSRLQEYEAEVAALSSLRHMNVVKLYCSITSEDSNLLVYEYMSNGSLWDRLHTYQKVEMDWNVRYEIALGAARGLEYLHHACDRPVIHRDVKSSNILLDEEMKPKIADFGLAKMLQIEKGLDSTHIIAGTHGYIAPEYGYTLNVTEKSDIYSFGVVLMELVTGRKPVEPEFGENKDIVYWVHKEMRTREDMIALVDPSISNYAKEEAVKVLSIAVRCTMRLPGLRPSMRMVVKLLEEIEPKPLVDIVIDKGSEKEISLCKT